MFQLFCAHCTSKWLPIRSSCCEAVLIVFVVAAGFAHDSVSVCYWCICHFLVCLCKSSLLLLLA